MSDTSDKLHNPYSSCSPEVIASVVHGLTKHPDNDGAHLRAVFPHVITSTDDRVLLLERLSSGAMMLPFRVYHYRIPHRVKHPYDIVESSMRYFFRRGTYVATRKDTAYLGIMRFTPEKAIIPISIESRLPSNDQSFEPNMTWASQNEHMRHHWIPLDDVEQMMNPDPTATDKPITGGASFVIGQYLDTHTDRER